MSIPKRIAIVMDGNGRSYVKYRVESVEFSLQDDGQTLKIFLEVNDEQIKN